MKKMWQYLLVSNEHCKKRTQIKRSLSAEVSSRYCTRSLQALETWWKRAKSRHDLAVIDKACPTQIFAHDEH